jgi:hypothetical protein
MLLQARPDFHEEDFQRIEEIIPDMHGPTGPPRGGGSAEFPDFPSSK